MFLRIVLRNMPRIPNLRSPYARIGALVHFGRMLDKIRLHAAGQLPADYHNNLGDPRPTLLDARCCAFIGIAYAALRTRTLTGGTDAEILAWAQHQAGPPSLSLNPTHCETWNHFLQKLGWRDDRSAFLIQRVTETGLAGKPIETFFDLIDYDEGRNPSRNRPWENRPPTALLVMGVCGAGKSTIGRALAHDLDWEFIDADDFHPPANRAKLSSAQALTDADRAPWLTALRAETERVLARGESLVLACSALKAAYRATLLRGLAATRTLHLHGTRDQLAARLATRDAHFMSPALLDSQLATLEAPATTEALILNLNETPAALIAAARAALLPSP